MAGGEAVPESKSIFVGGLALDASEEAVRGRFAAYGTIAELSAPAPRPPRREGVEATRHFYVTYESVDAARAAVAAENGKALGGATLRVDFRLPKRAARGPVEREEPNPAAIWIGGLPAGTTEEELNALVARFGKVASTTPRLNSRRPWAFVSFEAPAQASAAVAGLNGSAFKGETLNVEIQAAGKPKPRPAVEREVKPADPARVWISGFGSEVTKAEIRETFGAAGEITSLNASTGPRYRRPFAHITYSSVEEATAAVDRFNGKELLGGTISVEPARETTVTKKAKKSGGGGGGSGAAAGGAAAGGGGRSRRTRTRKDESPNPCRVWIGGISRDVGRDEVTAFFGEGVKAVLLRGRSGWVLFETEAQAQAAIARSGQSIAGHEVEISAASAPDSGILRRHRRADRDAGPAE